MAVVATLDVVLRAATAPFEKGIRRTIRSVRGLTHSVAGLAAAVGVGFTFKSAIDSARDFQQAMTTSMAIMGDVSEAMRRDMSDAAESLARTTKFSAKEIAESFYFLASAGLSAKQSIAALPVVTAFAQAGDFDLAAATELLTDAQSALGLKVEDVTQNMINMRKVSDTLVDAANRSNASVQQFSEALTNQAGAALRLANKSIEEGVAVLAVFADQGLKGAAAGTALQIVLRDLQNSAIKSAGAWQRYGIRVFDSAGKMRNMADIIQDLSKVLVPLNDRMRKITAAQLGFQDKSFAFTQTLLGQADAIRKYEMALRAAGGVTEAVAEKQITPFNKAMKELRAIWESFAVSAITPVLDGIGESSLAATKLAQVLAVILDISHDIGIAWSGVDSVISKASAKLLRFGAFSAKTHANVGRHLRSFLGRQRQPGETLQQMEERLVREQPLRGDTLAAELEAAAELAESDVARKLDEFFTRAGNKSPGDKFLEKLAKQEEEKKQTKALREIQDLLSKGTVLLPARLTP